MAHVIALPNKTQADYGCYFLYRAWVANMVTACGTATANNILFWYFRDTFASSTGSVLSKWSSQSSGISTNDAFRAVCRYFDRIERPEQVMTALINAMRVLTDPVRLERSALPCRRMLKERPLIIQHLSLLSGFIVCSGVPRNQR